MKWKQIFASQVTSEKTFEKVQTNYASEDNDENTNKKRGVSAAFVFKPARPQACGCGSSPGSASGRGRGLPAGGTAEARGVVGSSTDSRFGFLPLSRSMISSPDSVSNSSRPLARASRSARFSVKILVAWL